MEKKSERLEVRLGYEEKQTFTEACENQGDTPSGAVRRFISGYVRRSDADLLSSAWRNFKRKRWVVGTGVVSLLLLGAFSFNLLLPQKSMEYNFGGASAELQAAVEAYPQEGVTRPVGIDPEDTGPPIQEMTFKKWDRDNSGLLEVGEILPNDIHLHRVLDTDAVIGISLSEFFTEGRMHYREVDSISIEDKSEQLSYKYTGASPEHVVDFDLSGSRPKIAVYLVTAETSSVTPHRLIVWQRDKELPVVNFSHHDFRPRNINQ